ncbi:MAG: hypothetical protein ACKVOJ_05005 [Sphingomonadaceae bacterium]
MIVDDAVVMLEHNFIARGITARAMKLRHAD